MVKLEKNKAFVIFKKPFEKEFNFLSGPWIKTNISQKPGEGFVLAPFDLNRNLAYHIQGKSKVINSFPKNIDSLIKIKSWKPLKSNTDYKDLVDKALINIRKGDFKKIVLSRCEIQSIPKGFELGSYFEKISAAYPECMVYLIHIPNEACWFGASPELLGKFSSENIFQTVALAGTIKKSDFLNGQKWTEKEIIEQELVTDFIIKKINNLSPGLLSSRGPENVETGDLIHLKSSIEAEIAQDVAMQLVLALHPSPAVSGIPQKKAIDYINNNENYEREFYSGFFGIIESSSEFEFYVNLRCMQLLKQEAILYAGAGITTDSDSGKEYLETSNKLNALKRHFHA
ncbi:chorismate-binding protein [Hyphobacterium sp. CCMP332]|nr:chorismate-binding protein [Hyphobacterium sp. CCMP332]